MKRCYPGVRLFRARERQRLVVLRNRLVQAGLDDGKFTREVALLRLKLPQAVQLAAQRRNLVVLK